MYRASGPSALRSVGEVEFANGVGAMAASGLFGEAKVCAGIVGRADLLLGDETEEVLRAHIHAGGGRYRGVRHSAAFDTDAMIWGAGVPALLRDGTFRAGFRLLQKLGLTFDALVLEPQLPDVIDLAHAFPNTQIILNHVGLPVGAGRYQGKREARFPLWRNNIRKLSQCSNVAVKLGGLDTGISGFQSFTAKHTLTSEELAEEWRPYIETCIEAFGVDRCMFESNFPAAAGVVTYRVLWNAFKRIVGAASRQEKTALFSGTAARIYRLDF